MAQRVGRTVRTIQISGFDPQGEPEIRVKSNGTLQLVFEFMPPSYAQTPQEQAQYDAFDQKLRAAIGAGVEWDDREVFIVQSAAPIVIERLQAYLSRYCSGIYERVIQIDAMPKTGNAPEVIRQQWVGLKLPLSQRIAIQPQKYKSTQTLKSGKTKETWQYGYWVEASVAIELLAQSAPHAAQWFRDHEPQVNTGMSHLVFDASCCHEMVALDW